MSPRLPHPPSPPNLRAALCLAVLVLAILGWLPSTALARDGSPPRPAPAEEVATGLSRILTPSPPGGSLILTPQVSLLPDPSMKMGIDWAASPENAAGYRLNEGVNLVVGAIDGAVWLRLPSIPPPPDKRGWVLELTKSLVEEVDIYIPTSRGDWDHMAGGTYRSWNRSAELFRNPSFFLPSVPDGESVYVRLYSRFKLNLALVLWTQKAFQEHVQADSYLNGIILGIPLALILFNLFIFISLRDRVYLYYVAFMFSMFLYQVNLQGQIHLLHLLDGETSLMVFGVLAGFILVLGSQFSRKFLMLRHYSRTLDRLFLFCIVVGAVRIGISLMGFHQFGNHLSQAMGLFSPLLAVSAGLICWRRGFAPARYYLLAWSVLTLCIAWQVFVSLGLFPWTGLSSIMMAVGSDLEALLLSFALADRIRLLRREREQLERSTNLYQRLSQVDGLTGLYNLRHFKSELLNLVAMAREEGAPLALVMLDIDDFKLFNDAYGHPEGDKVLTGLAEVLRENLREGDLAFRYGGEEFVILFYGQAVHGAREAAERVRRGMSSRVFNPREGTRVCVTLSLGLAELQEGDEPIDLLKRADSAMYEAKGDGKNRTVVNA